MTHTHCGGGPTGRQQMPRPSAYHPSAGTHQALIIAVHQDHTYCMVFRNEGLGEALLACAGYSGPGYTPCSASLSGTFPATWRPVGSASMGGCSACLVCIRTPEADRHLQRIHRRIPVDGHKEMPQAMKHSSNAPGAVAAAQAAHSSPQHFPPPFPLAGPHPIRTRHCAARAVRFAQRSAGQGEQ